MDARRRVLDDLASLANSAVGLLQGAGQEAEALVRQRLETILDRMDLVPREEFEAVKEMARKAREENAALSARLDALEKQRAAAKPAKRARKTASPRKPSKRQSA